MRSLFGSPPAKRRVLPASLRRLIVDLKAEHPPLNLNEIARICHVRTGRKSHPATAGAQGAQAREVRASEVLSAHSITAGAFLVRGDAL